MEQSKAVNPPLTSTRTLVGMAARNQFDDVSAPQITEWLRDAASRSEAFDPGVVFELARRAEIDERLQARVRTVALRELAPVDGYGAGDF